MTREQATQEAAEMGYTDTEPTPYTGPLVAGQRFVLAGKGNRHGEVLSVIQSRLSSYDDDGPVDFWKPGSYCVGYRSINQKTGLPWQGMKFMSVEQCEELRGK